MTCPLVRPAEHLSAPLLVHLARRMQTEAEAELAGIRPARAATSSR